MFNLKQRKQVRFWLNLMDHITFLIEHIYLMQFEPHEVNKLDLQSSALDYGEGVHDEVAKFTRKTIQNRKKIMKKIKKLETAFSDLSDCEKSIDIAPSLHVLYGPPAQIPRPIPVVSPCV